MTLSFRKLKSDKVIYLVPLVTLIFLPNASEAAIAPKFYLQIAVAIVAIIYLIREKKIVSDNMLPFYAHLILAIALILSLISQEQDIYEMLSGTWGRRSGLLTYISLLAISLFFAYIRVNYQLLLKICFATGVIQVAYAYLQYLNLDPFPWFKPADALIGTLGNPNFLAAFIAIAVISGLSILFASGREKIERVIPTILLIYSLLILNATNTSQGFFMFGIGLFVYLWLYLRGKNPSRKIFQTFWSFTIFTFTSILLGLLGHGPFNAFHDYSVIDRGHMWRVGLQIFMHNPINGTGLDTYKYYEEKYRSQESIALYGAGPHADASHNIFIDLAYGGGLILLLSYLFFLGVTLYFIKNYLKRIRTFDPVFASLFGCWIAYQAQSVISINQLGLSVWGFVFNGALIRFCQYHDYKSRYLVNEGRTYSNR